MLSTSSSFSIPPFLFALCAGNDDIQDGVLQSAITQSVWEKRYVFVVVAGYQQSGPMYVRVTYTDPTRTPTATRSPSGTPTQTNSPGGTATQTPSLTSSTSVSATSTPSVDYTVDPTDTPSQTGTGTRTPPVTASPSFGVTRTSTASPTGSPTASITASHTATSSPACANQVAITQTIQGPAAAGTANVTLSAALPLLQSLGTSPCGGVAFPFGPKAVFSLDLGASSGGSLPLGYALKLSTCVSNATTVDTLVWTGYGCPVSPSSFRCAGANDDSVPAGEDGTGAVSCSIVTIPVVQSWPVYVVVSGAGGLVGSVGMSYSYALPSPSASVTPLSRPTRSITASASSTPSSTATLSTGVQPSGSPTVSTSATATVSVGYTASSSASFTPSPTRTGTPNVCGVAVLGEAYQDTVTAGNSSSPVWLNATLDIDSGDELYGEANCASGSPSLTSGVKHAYVIDIPAGLQIGGSLVLNACHPDNTLDVTLHVGRGCPSSAASFSCLGGSWASCGSLRTALTIAPVTKRRYYLLVSGNTFSSSGDYAVRVTYGTPLPTPSNTPSPSMSQSAGATPSVSSSWSSSATPTPSLGYTETPSNTATPPRTETSSVSATASVSSSGSETASVSASASITASVTSSASATTTATPTNTRSRTGSQTGTPSSSQTGSQTGTPSSSQTGSKTATQSSSQTGSLTGTPSSSQTQSGTPSSSQTQTGTPSSSQTGSQTGSPSSSQTGSSTGSLTASASVTTTSTATGSLSVTPSQSAAETQTPSRTAVPTPSVTRSVTGSITKSRLPTPTSSGSRSKTKTRTKTRTRTKVGFAHISCTFKRNGQRVARV